MLNKRKRNKELLPLENMRTATPKAVVTALTVTVDTPNIRTQSRTDLTETVVRKETVVGTDMTPPETMIAEKAETTVTTVVSGIGKSVGIGVGVRSGNGVGIGTGVGKDIGVEKRVETEIVVGIERRDGTVTAIGVRVGTGGEVGVGIGKTGAGVGIGKTGVGAGIERTERDAGSPMTMISTVTNQKGTRITNLRIAKRRVLILAYQRVRVSLKSGGGLIPASRRPMAVGELLPCPGGAEMNRVVPQKGIENEEIRKIKGQNTTTVMESGPTRSPLVRSQVESASLGHVQGGTIFLIPCMLWLLTFFFTDFCVVCVSSLSGIKQS